MVSSVDVAKLAGVSQATVSRVLNNPDKVNPSTVVRVNDAIKELNYRPNAAARSLISRKSGIIALLCGTLEEPENAEFANKVISYSQEKGYRTEIHIQDSRKPGAIFDAIGFTQAEGVIAGPLIAGEIEMAILENSGIPYVLHGWDTQKSGNSITLDNQAAGRMAADHILSLNKHQVVGWLGGSSADRRLQDRYEGFLERMDKRNTEVISVMGDITDYDDVLTAMMARKNRPSAIITATDALGAYAIDFLLDFGYSIAEDITVVAIGNSKQSSRAYLKMDSIGLPEGRDTCKEAVDHLAELITGEVETAASAAKIAPELYFRTYPD